MVQPPKNFFLKSRPPGLLLSEHRGPKDGPVSGTAPASWMEGGSERESRSVVSNSLRPHGLYSPWNSSGQNTGVGSISLLQGNLPNPGIESRSPTLQADSLPAEPPGKPKNTGLGSVPLLQGIFPDAGVGIHLLFPTHSASAPTLFYSKLFLVPTIQLKSASSAWSWCMWPLKGASLWHLYLQSQRTLVKTGHCSGRSGY